AKSLLGQRGKGCPDRLRARLGWLRAEQTNRDAPDWANLAGRAGRADRPLPRQEGPCRPRRAADGPEAARAPPDATAGHGASRRAVLRRPAGCRALPGRGRLAAEKGRTWRQPPAAKSSPRPSPSRPHPSARTAVRPSPPPFLLALVAAGVGAG